MRQIIHILQKDVRRFWLEILISILLLAAFVWIEPKLWHDYYLVGAYRSAITACSDLPSLKRFCCS